MTQQNVAISTPQSAPAKPTRPSPTPPVAKVAPSAKPRPKPRAPWSAFSLFLLLMGFVVLSMALAHSRFHYLPGSNFGYNLGLIGGILMLLLLFYPLRKRLTVMRSWLP